MSSLPILEPELALPGAGLPLPELFIARFLFLATYWTGSPKSFTQTFLRERRAIQDLYENCDVLSGTRRVLVARLPGMEDSSRYWSIWMTLEHLRIVNTSIATAILELSQGRIPPGRASTALVKPAVGITKSVVPEYEASCDALLKAADKIPDPKPQVRYAHPWFGPLDALGWQALAGIHMAIHRKQIQKIGCSLRKDEK